jgi:hypothetical protein
MVAGMVTDAEHPDVLPMLQAIGGLAETTWPEAPLPPDLTVTVMFAVAPNAGEPARRDAANASSRIRAPFMSPPWPSVRFSRSTRPE